MGVKSCTGVFRVSNYREQTDGSCLARGELTFDDLEVHHIVKLTDSPNLLLEDGNLIGLCVRHHERAESGEIPKKELYELVKMRDVPPPEG